MHDTGDLYTIGHVVLFTGLTDRTIRSYIASGILQGEKINGLWHFTAEQVESFVRHPSVRPSILAKKNGMVYDFMLETKRAKPEICIILDFPGEDEKKVSEFFCYNISNGDYHDIRFTFDGCEKTPRVIIKGDTGEVLRLVNAYYEIISKSRA